MTIKDRYDRDHIYNKIIFSLPWVDLDIEQCRFIILKVIEQGVRDYLAYQHTDNGVSPVWIEAKDFLFDRTYKVEWGDLELSLEDLLLIVDINADYFREHIKERFEEKYGKRHRKRRE